MRYYIICRKNTLVDNSKTKNLGYYYALNNKKKLLYISLKVLNQIKSWLVKKMRLGLLLGSSSLQKNYTYIINH